MASADPRPLAGKRVVVTRAPEQAQEFVRQLENLGAEVLLMPAVSFSDPEDFAPLDAALRSLRKFEWILFTSQNAVRFFCKRCRALGLDCAALQSPRPLAAAVGSATAAAAREEGLRVDYVASRFRGAALAEELWESIAGRTILLPRSDRAGDELPVALRAAAAEVIEVVAYRTGMPAVWDARLLERIRCGDADVVAFASPSAFHHFADAVGAETMQALADRTQFAAIGPTTAGAIRDGGFRAAIEAGEETAASLATAIVKYYERQHSGVKSP